MKHLLATLSLLLLTNVAAAQLSCTVTSCGTSCGPTLAVTYTPNGGNGNYTIQMDAAGLHPNSLLGLYWGDGPQSIPLPGGCDLLINPIWGTFHTSSATGTFSWGRTWPHWATARFYMQMGSLEILPNGSWSALTTECQIGQCW